MITDNTRVPCAIVTMDAKDSFFIGVNGIKYRLNRALMILNSSGPVVRAEITCENTGAQTVLALHLNDLLWLTSELFMITSATASSILRKDTPPCS